MSVGLAALGVIFLLLALHPFVTYPASLNWLRGRRRRPIRPIIARGPETPVPAMAICVCAYNEEAVIQRKARNLLALRKTVPELEIMIFVDAATDRTAELLRPYRDRIHVIVSPTRQGKTYGMNLMVAHTTAPIVVFTDANVLMDEASLRRLVPYFDDPDVGCVCGHLIYDNGAEHVTAASGAAYWRIEERIKQLESDTGSAMGADGSLFAIRRSLHRPVPEELFDDMIVSFRILCAGYRVVRAADVIAYERSAASLRDEFTRKVRIACNAFSGHRLLWPELRRLPACDLYKYVSHKLLRWLAVFNLAAAVLCFLGAAWLIGRGGEALALAGAGLVLLALGFALRLPMLAKLADILLAFVATGIGVVRAMLGHSMRTWTPAASIRRAEAQEDAKP